MAALARARSPRKREANAFDIDVKARKQKGEVLPSRAARRWRPRMPSGGAFVGYHLAKNTQISYQRHWKAHVKSRFDHYKLSEWVANPQLFDELIADMDERGVGTASQRKVLVVMSAVFSATVEWKKVGVNPVLAVPKPSGTRKRIPAPLPPMVVERIILQMRRRKPKDAAGVRPIADACFVELMAYGGLRPGEALALTWGDIGNQTLGIDKAVALGEEGPPKTGGARSVPLVDALADDLHDLYVARREPSEDQCVLACPSRRLLVAVAVQQLAQPGVETGHEESGRR